MKLPFNGLSIINKLLIFFLLVAVAALANLYVFNSKSRTVGLYDDMTGRISEMGASITELEYLLDMFVVARRFESTTIELIKGDVDKLDDNVTGLLSGGSFSPLFEANAPLFDGFLSITEDWQNVKVEIGRLNDELSQEEIMLIHNAVDVHTVLMSEKTDRLLALVSESRHAVFSEIRSLQIKSVIGFILLSLFVTVAYYKKFAGPLRKAGKTARRVASGNHEARFREDKWTLVGRFGTELNQMLEVVAVEREQCKLLYSSAEERLAAEGLRTRSFSKLMDFASRSLASASVLEKAVAEAASGASADAGAAFIGNGAALKLMATSGLGSGEAKGLAQISVPCPDKDGPGYASPAVFSSMAEYPDSFVGEYFTSCGFESMARLPILYNGAPLGFIFLLSRKRVDLLAHAAPFLEAICSGAGVALGHAGLYQFEHGERRFIERVVNQMPFGLAVFDKSGTCRVINTTLKKMLGAERVELVGEYSILGDGVLKSSGILPSIKKAYEGYATEFTIDYDPAHITEFPFSGAPKRLKVKSFPLYDGGGDISNIVLLYEDLGGHQAAGEKPGDVI